MPSRIARVIWCRLYLEKSPHRIQGPNPMAIASFKRRFLSCESISECCKGVPPEGKWEDCPHLSSASAQELCQSTQALGSFLL